jgi:hypothetical protein
MIFDKYLKKRSLLQNILFGKYFCKMEKILPKKSLLTIAQMIGFFKNLIILQKYYYYYVVTSTPKLNDIL